MEQVLEVDGYWLSTGVEWRGLCYIKDTSTW